MYKDNINVSKIETYLHSIIDNVVSDNTYVGTPPETLKESWNDICVIDVGPNVKDMNAYGKGVVLVWLYARPLANGAKNVAKMSELETKLNEVIKNAHDRTYRINRGATYSDYDSQRKWHCNIVELNLTIV
jgi:hypothetical protein